jgi:hypothetical protein
MPGQRHQDRNCRSTLLRRTISTRGLAGADHREAIKAGLVPRRPRDLVSANCASITARCGSPCIVRKQVSWVGPALPALRVSLPVAAVGPLRGSRA